MDEKIAGRIPKNTSKTLVNFLPSECEIKPKDINIKGMKTRKDGQLIIKINY